MVAPDIPRNVRLSMEELILFLRKRPTAERSSYLSGNWCAAVPSVALRMLIRPFHSPQSSDLFHSGSKARLENRRVACPVVCTSERASVAHQAGGELHSKSTSAHDRAAAHACLGVTVASPWRRACPRPQTNSREVLESLTRPRNRTVPGLLSQIKNRKGDGLGHPKKVLGTER